MSTQAEIGAHLDLSVRRVRDVLRLLGLPTRNAPLDEARLRYIRHLRELAAGHGDSSSGLDLANERALLARAQREQIEQQMAVRRQELVEVAPLRRTLDGVAHTVRDGILAVPHRLAPVIAAETDADRVHQLMSDELRAALTRIADTGKALPNEQEPEEPDDDD